MTTINGGKKLNVNEEITETVNESETATELNDDDDCPSCTCECASTSTVTDLSTATLSNAKSDDEKFVDLLDIYNQSDLDNGIFNDGMCRNM